MLILGIIRRLIGCLFLTLAAAAGFVLLYIWKTDVKEVRSERVEFEITSPTCKKILKNS